MSRKNRELHDIRDVYSFASMPGFTLATKAQRASLEAFGEKVVEKIKADELAQVSEHNERVKRAGEPHRIIVL